MQTQGSNELRDNIVNVYGVKQVYRVLLFCCPLTPLILFCRLTFFERQMNVLQAVTFDLVEVKDENERKQHKPLTGQRRPASLHFCYFGTDLNANACALQACG